MEDKLSNPNTSACIFVAEQVRKIGHGMVVVVLVEFVFVVLVFVVVLAFTVVVVAGGGVFVDAVDGVLAGVVFLVVVLL